MTGLASRGAGAADSGALQDFDVHAGIPGRAGDR